MIAVVLALALGVIAPNINQASIGHTICRSGYTATVRPSASFTNRLKRAQLAAYRDRNPRHFEEDHIIPLELGGAPRDPANLRPQPWPRARVKDREETSLHRAVCAGRVSLAVARETILRHWLAEYPGYTR